MKLSVVRHSSHLEGFVRAHVKVLDGELLMHGEHLLQYVLYQGDGIFIGKANDLSYEC